VSNFFVKINKTGVPAETINPQSGADWETGQFIAPKAKRLNPDPRGKLKKLPAKDPQKGDGVYIWVNQISKGYGLTARGTITEVRQTGGNITFLLRDVELLGPPYLHCFAGDRPRQFARGTWRAAVTETENHFLHHVHSDRRVRTIELSDDNVTELTSVLESSGVSSIFALSSAIASNGSPQAPSISNFVGSGLQENAQITIEDEFQLAEKSVISQHTRDVISRDLPTFAAEGMTAERWTKIRLRAMWLADKFISERVRASSLHCDDCGFDPKTRDDLSSIKPRSLLDVHHKDPLAEGERYTTTADFALLCPTCHRIAHSLIRLSH
jgi:HNH endonuclease